MRTPSIVETVGRNLARFLLSFAPDPVGATPRARRSATCGNRVTMLGNGQMLLPGIAEPRLLTLQED